MLLTLNVAFDERILRSPTPIGLNGLHGAADQIVGINARRRQIASGQDEKQQ
jgi:hypothetical protein